MSHTFVRSLIFSVMEFLNVSQDGINALLCSGIVLKNNGTSLEFVGHVQHCDDFLLHLCVVRNLT
jgi:hypothetical protein